jgi:hypothetical protein
MVYESIVGLLGMVAVSLLIGLAIRNHSEKNTHKKEQQ